MQTLKCSEDVPITCSILEVVEAISKGPDGFQWTASIWIPAAAAIVSAAVLVFSVLTSRRAKTQADETEKARVKAEEDRRNAEHEDRMRVAFAAIFSSIGTMTALMLTPARGTVPQAIDSPLLGDIAAARLEANSVEERRLLDRLDDLIFEVRKIPGFGKRGVVLSQVRRLVIDWLEHDNAYRDSVIFPRFDELVSAAMEPTGAWPSWVRA